jgi:hypothetical protein
MRVRVLKAFQCYKRGQEFDWPDGMARIFAARGMVEEIKEQRAEAAVIEDDVERAVADDKPRKRRK